MEFEFVVPKMATEEDSGQLAMEETAFLDGEGAEKEPREKVEPQKAEENPRERRESGLKHPERKLSERKLSEHKVNFVETPPEGLGSASDARREDAALLVRRNSLPTTLTSKSTILKAEKLLQNLRFDK